MRKDLLAPSIMCADLMNIEGEIKKLEEAQVDLLHFDIMDTTFTTSTMLPPIMIPQVKAITAIPLDIHVMSMYPERYLDSLLPHCDSCFVSVQAESDPLAYYTLSALKAGGAKVGLAFNKGTPIDRLEEFASLLDFVLVMNGVAGVTGPKLKIDESLCRKIRRAREIMDAAGKEEAFVEVDGAISPENAKIAKESGANAYVLGSSSLYRKDLDVLTACKDFRKFIAKGDS